MSTSQLISVEGYKRGRKSYLNQKIKNQVHPYSSLQKLHVDTELLELDEQDLKSTRLIKLRLMR